MSGVQIFNAVEAAFWLLLAMATARFGHRTSGFTRRRQFALFMFLLAFGISDVWEIYSGVWWRPAALVVLKAACLFGVIVTASLIYASRWREK